MEKYIVKQLRDLAKVNSLRGYYKLKKATRLVLL